MSTRSFKNMFLVETTTILLQICIIYFRSINDLDYVCYFTLNVKKFLEKFGSLLGNWALKGSHEFGFSTWCMEI